MAQGFDHYDADVAPMDRPPRRGHFNERPADRVTDAAVAEPNKQRFAQILVGPTANLVGLSLLEADLRSRSGGTVVGIQRGGQKIIGPTAGEVVHAGDLLLVLGRPDNLKALKTQVFDS